MEQQEAKWAEWKAELAKDPDWVTPSSPLFCALSPSLAPFSPPLFLFLPLSFWFSEIQVSS